MFEWIDFAILIAGHNHTRHPEENNVRPCYEIRGWIIVVNLFIVGMIDPIKNRNRP